jgi:hydantoinase/carbamoylase family amidase
MTRLDALAACSDEPDRLTRLYLSPAHVAAAELVRDWMRQAGMTATVDAVGNVVGRREGVDPRARAILLGSHIDTVRDAGKYDGTLGVVAAIEAVQALRASGERFVHPIEVFAFGDEEGVRFPSTLIGSRAVAGSLDPLAFEACDADGISVRAALRATFGDAARYQGCARRHDEVAAYLELHIEQGPVLEAEDLPLGIVTAINGATRARVVTTGLAGHAGTVPMSLRRDALTAAAEMVLAVENAGLAASDMVATVGRLEVLPGAANTIPGSASFTIDVRGPDDYVRRRAVGDLCGAFEAIALRRSITVSSEPYHEACAVQCDPWLTAILEDVVRGLGVKIRRLSSGAGHDAMAMADLCPVAMLFVRCRQGMSHHPAEAISIADADLGVRALIAALRHLDIALGAAHVGRS